MLRYSLKRLLLAFVTAFIILTLTFIMVKALPISLKISSSASDRWAFYMKQVDLGYFNVIVKPDTEHYKPTMNIIESIVRDKQEYFFYPKPILEQYFSWLGNIFTKWDWGTSTSLEINTSAIRLIGRRLPVSMSINIIVVLVSVPLGILLGIYAGLKKNTWIDHTISTLIMIFVSIPGFVVITFLIFFLSYQTGWLPPSWPSVTAPPATRALGYIIPVLSLSFGSICGYGRGLRNAFVPILPSVLAEFIGILGGSVILERLYGIPGAGSIYLEALSNTPRDYNVLMVDMAVFTIIGLLAGILFDLSYGFIDPRIRMGAKK